MQRARFGVDWVVTKARRNRVVACGTLSRVMRGLSRTIVATLLLSTGCYASHGLGEPVPEPLDATVGGACTFTVGGFRGDVPVIACRVELDSEATCVDVATCLCASATAPAELRICIASHLAPRGAITLSDYCSGFPDRAVSLTEALEGYLGAESISPACDGLLATLGEHPYVSCHLIESYYCPCVPGACDADSLLGSPCLDHSFAVAECIVEGLNAAFGAGDICDARLSELVAGCH